MEMNMIGVVKIVICLTSTLLCVLALALPKWVVRTNDTDNTYIGLWKACDNDKCNYVEEGAAIINLERAMVTMAVFLLFGSLICAIIQMKQGQEQEGGASTTSVASALSAIAGLCLLVGFSACVDYVGTLRDAIPEGSKIDVSYGASFALAIVGWLLSWTQTGLFIGLGSRSEEQKGVGTP